MRNVTSKESSINHLDSDHYKLNVTLYHVFTDDQIAACRPTNATTKTQRQCVERTLGIAPCHTMFFRAVLGICSPAPRIFELRHDQGSNIISRLITVNDATGTAHKKVSLYSQHSGVWARYEE